MASGITPPALRKGDTIAFLSPSLRLNHVFPTPLDRAKVYLEGLGYHVKIIFNASEPETFRELVLQRCEEVHSAFRDPDINAIMCTLGGSNANELLPHLDYELIKSNPKIFCGYSDITVLHYAFFTQSDLRTFYGPAAITELGCSPQPLPFTIKNFLHVLQESAGKPIGPVPRSLEWAEKKFDFAAGDISQRPRELSPPGWIWLRAGKATGRVFGGCLPTVLQLAGTKFWPDHRGRILLLETPVGEKVEDPFPLSSARARMADLRNMGVFEEITGLVIGRPFGYDEKMRKDFAQMVEDQCYGTDFPILLNVDFGHIDPMLTIPLNALASLDSGKEEFNILETGVTLDGSEDKNTS